jgi:hypothetical protein
MKKDNKAQESGITRVFSYEVAMLVHVVADSETEARAQLDEKGGIVTKRDVKVLNAVALYGEKEQ